MSAVRTAQHAGSGSTAVRLFQVGFPEAELIELGRRINAARWAERAYPDNLLYFNEVDKGGHFAAWEQPQLFSQEIRAAFRPLRQKDGAK